MATARSALVAELKSRRNDTAGLLHAHDRYAEVVNQAIREAPRFLWTPAVNTSVVTAEDTRRYPLAALAGLTEPGQVRRIWMDDDDDFDLPIGRWEVEDNAGTLNLVLDETPTEAGRVLTIEYLKPFAELASDVATTDLDRDWLCAQAMVYLLLEASPGLEDKNYITAQLTYWDQARQGRQLELWRQYRPPSRKIRTRG